MLFVLPEEPVHLCDFVQYKEPTPHDGWTRWPVMLAIQIATQHRDPQHGLLQRWGVLWWLRCVVRVAIQRLPFDGLQQYFARQIRADSCQQGRIQDAPGDDGKQSRRAYEPLEIAELPGLDLATAFQHAMPGLNRPTSRIPGQSLENIINNWLLVFRGHRICL